MKINELDRLQNQKSKQIALTIPILNKKIHYLNNKHENVKNYQNISINHQNKFLQILTQNKQNQTIKTNKKQNNSNLNHENNIKKHINQLFLKNYEFQIQNCIYSNCSTARKLSKIYKIYNKYTSKVEILKIIQVNLINLERYKKYAIKSIQYYYLNEYQQIDKKTHNQEQIYNQKQNRSFLISSKFHFKINESQKTAILFMIRPYFTGRSLYEEISNFNRILYTKEQLPILLTQTLSILFPSSQNILEFNFLPTLDNIYYTFEKLNLNNMSFDGYFYLNGVQSSIQLDKFKSLYLLLDSDINIYIDSKTRKHYLSERMKVKALFLILFCFVTLQVPNLLNGEYFEEKELKLSRVTVQGSQMRNLITSLPSRWDYILNNNRNQRALKQYSNQYMPQKTPSMYLLDLMKRIFVKEQKIGWKQLFLNEPFFIKILKYQKPPIQQIFKTFPIQIAKNISSKYSLKVQTIYNAFVRFHKYLVSHDKMIPKSMRSRIVDQIYLPQKIGLGFEFYLNKYQQWYEVFFVQSQDYRQQVYSAAQKLLDLIDKNAEMMIKSRKVKTLDLQKIWYVLCKKLQEIRKLTQKQYQIEEEFLRFQKKLLNLQIYEYNQQLILNNKRNGFYNEKNSSQSSISNSLQDDQSLNLLQQIYPEFMKNKIQLLQAFFKKTKSSDYQMK